MPETTMSVTLGSFDPALVALSFLISVFGSWCGLTCAARARRRSGLASILWLLASAVAIGGGAIWSMHFIGMLAYQSPMVYSLDMTITLTSMLAAIGAAAVGMAIATSMRGTGGLLLGGVVTGTGVAVMHYLGMSAMQMSGEVSYKAPVVVASLVIAIVAATLALFFALTLDSTWMRILAAGLMGVGVCAMHYTGMLAMTMTPSTDGLAAGTTSGVDPFSLALPIFGISSVLLLVLLFAGLLDETGESFEDDVEWDPVG